MRMFNRDKKIGFLGGCQLRAPAYYLNLLDSNINCKWLNSNNINTLTWPDLTWPHSHITASEYVENSYSKYSNIGTSVNIKDIFIWDCENVKKYLPLCDVILYQDIIPEYKDHTQVTMEDMLELKSTECQLIKISRVKQPLPSRFGNIIFTPGKVHKDYNLDTIREEASGDVNVSKDIYNRCVDLGLDTSEDIHKIHHSSFIYLEVIRQICNILNIQFFDEETYSKIMSIQTW